MALQGCLKVGGRIYGVVHCEYEFRQEVDSAGKPTSRPAGGSITFVTPATSDDDTFFYKWMIHKTEKWSGVFRFCVYSNDNKRSIKTVQFLNAYCVGLRDCFDDQDSKLMYTTVTISAEVIRIGTGDGVMLINEWGGTMESIRDQFENTMNQLGLGGMF